MIVIRFMVCLKLPYPILHSACDGCTSSRTAKVSNPYAPTPSDVFSLFLDTILFTYLFKLS